MSRAVGLRIGRQHHCSINAKQHHLQTYSCRCSSSATLIIIIVITWSEQILYNDKLSFSCSWSQLLSRIPLTILMMISSLLIRLKQLVLRRDFCEQKLKPEKTSDKYLAWLNAMAVFGLNSFKQLYSISARIKDWSSLWLNPLN
jgi:hypothetical protein